MTRRMWLVALSGWLAFALAAAVLGWHLANPPPKPVAAQPSELEIQVGSLQLRLSNAQAALQEAQAQLEDTEAQLTTARRYQDMAERWAGGLSRWGPMGWLYWGRGFTEIGPPVNESRWWNFGVVDELLFQWRGVLLTVQELRQVDPAQDPMLSREVIAQPRLTTAIDGYQWVGLDYREPIQIHVAGRRVETKLVLLDFPPAADECAVYLELADGSWLKAVVAHDMKPLQRWLKELYENKGPYD